MVLIVGWWSAFAQPATEVSEPAPAEDPAPEADEDVEAEPEPSVEELVVLEGAPTAEVVVYGERLVDQARREVVETIEELGYGYEVKDQGDRVVYRHPAAWYGEVVLHDDGWMQVKRQKLRVEGRSVPWAKRQNSVGAWLGCFVYPWACIRVYGATVSRRRWMGTQSRTVAQLEPKVQTLGDRIADLETARRAAELPDRLEALWETGTPLAKGPRLKTYAARRQAILDHWDSRTDTVWGRRVRQAIVNFVEAVVQDGPDPFTRAELAAFNDGRDTPLVLEGLAP
ncbi:MAG: hypothetical protein AAGA48_07105 [Myxococcota bacterium]